MPTATLLPPPRFVFFDANGNPLAAGLVHTYVPGGGTTLKTTWQDALETTPNSNPIVLDSAGSALIYGAGIYQLTTTDALGNAIAAYSGVTSAYLQSGVFASIAALRANATIATDPYEVNVLGYTTYADGGEGTFVYVPTDHTSIDNGGTVIVDAAGQRWHRETSGMATSAKWFGAVGDGVHDDTLPLQAAINTNTRVYLPTGIYKTTATLLMANIGQAIFGDGQQSNIKTSSATLDILNVTAAYVDISLLHFGSSVTRTAGAMITATEPDYLRIDGVTMEGVFNGIVINGTGGGPTGVHISHTRIINNTNASGNGVVINGGVDYVLENMWITGTSPTVQMANGILINACGDLTLDHVSTVYTGNGLAMAPAAGAIVQAVLVNDCFFDSGNGAGIAIEAAGTVQLVKFENTWSATNASGGMVMGTSGAGAVQQVDATNCVFSNTTGAGNSGVTVANAGVANLTFIDCSFSANVTHGLNLGTGVSLVKVIGCSLGQSGEFAGNTGFGLVIGVGCQYVVVSDNNFIGNSGGTVSIASPDFFNVLNVLHHNLGFVTSNNGVATVPAGTNPTLVVAHGLSIAPSSVTLGMTNVSYQAAVIAESATTFTLQLNGVVPGAVSVYWRADTGPNA